LQFYYNESKNEIIFNKKGFDPDTLSNHGFFNETYQLGYLLIEFIELDFNHIIQLGEKELRNPILPQSEEHITDYIDHLHKFHEKLLDIHPYFGTDYMDINEYILNVEIDLYKFLTCKEILSYSDDWFKSDDNIDYIIDKNYYHIRHAAEYLKLKTISLDEFKEKINNEYLNLKETIPDVDIKKYIIEFIKRFEITSKRFKKAVNFCLDMDDPKELIKLTPPQRYYLYQSQVDINISGYLVNVSYKANSLDDEFVDENYYDDMLSNNYKTNVNFDDIIPLLPSNPINIYEVYEVSDVQACYFELIKLITKGIFIRKCGNCHKYFINTGRIGTLYCDRTINEEGKTCKDVGAMNLYREKTKGNPIMEEYNKTYKKYNARVRYNKMTKSNFYKWSEEAREMRNKATLGEISFDDFKKWLNN